RRDVDADRRPVPGDCHRVRRFQIPGEVLSKFADPHLGCFHVAYLMCTQGYHIVVDHVAFRAPISQTQTPEEPHEVTQRSGREGCGLILLLRAVWARAGYSV